MITLDRQLAKIRPNELELLTDREKILWLPPEKLTVSEWADHNRVLTPMTSAEPGQWRTERTPYLKGIMDAFTDPFIEEISIMASTQVGKTECIYNMLGYVIDQDAGPTLLVMPRKEDAESVSVNRIQPMLLSSPALAKYLPKNSDHITKLEYHLDTMIVYFCGSNSPAALAQRPIRYLFLDEIDKYPKFSGKEADPIKLAKERTRTFWNRKIVKVSTPTIKEGYIYREYEKSDQCRYYVPCPHCGEYQYLVFPQVKFPKDERNPEKIEKLKLAWYECVHCQKRIDDNQKSRMLTQGVWAPEGSEIDANGNILKGLRETKHRGFWLNCLYSPWLTFGEVVAEFLRSKGYAELMMNFTNSWLAEPWIQKTEDPRPEKFRSLVQGYRERQIPSGIRVLTAGVDVQKNMFYVVIRGWGVGEESWLIRSCKVTTWEQLYNVICKTEYQVVGRKESLSVRMAFIDSGYNTAKVYSFCEKSAHNVRPIKGYKEMRKPFTVTEIDKNKIGGLMLINLDTTYYKDKLFSFINAEPSDSFAWHLYDSPDNDYIEQMCAEHKRIVIDSKGRATEEWQPVRMGMPNHYLDCEVYALVAADFIGVPYMVDDGQNVFTGHSAGNNEYGNWDSYYEDWPS